MKMERCQTHIFSHAKGREKEPTMNIPEEIIWEILLRLPVKSLFRFKCVDKYWRIVISDPNFISLHRTRSAENVAARRLIMMVSLKPNYYLNHIITISKAQFHQSTSFSVHPKPCMFPHPLSCSIDGFCYPSDVFIGSYNGIICLKKKHHNSPIVLWNPTIKWTKYVSLPRLNKTNDHINCGFGYDAARDDYKIIITVYDYTERMTRVDVYSAREHSWKEIELHSDQKSIYLHGDSPECIVQGNPFWVEKYTTGCITAFDMHDKVFRVIPRPRVLDLRKHWIWGVAELNGSLAVSFYCRDQEPINCFELWVMDVKHGHGHEQSFLWSWKHKASIGPVLGVTRYWCLPDGEILIQDGENREMKLLLCGIELKATNRVSIDGLRDIYTCHSYIETMVTINEKN